MKYKITPFNILSGILLLISIYLIIYPGIWGFGILIVYFALPAIFVTLLLDFMLQNLIKKYAKLVITEILIIGVLTLLYYI